MHSENDRGDDKVCPAYNAAHFLYYHKKSVCINALQQLRYFSSAISSPFCLPNAGYRIPAESASSVLITVAQLKMSQNTFRENLVSFQVSFNCKIN